MNGDSADPLWEFMKDKQRGLLGKRIVWNFQKFLVDKDGNVVNRYAPITSPEAISGDIEKLLAK